MAAAAAAKHGALGCALGCALGMVESVCYRPYSDCWNTQFRLLDLPLLSKVLPVLLFREIL